MGTPQGHEVNERDAQVIIDALQVYQFGGLEGTIAYTTNNVSTTVKDGEDSPKKEYREVQ